MSLSKILSRVKPTIIIVVCLHPPCTLLIGFVTNGIKQQNLYQMPEKIKQKYVTTHMIQELTNWVGSTCDL